MELIIEKFHDLKNVTFVCIIHKNRYLSQISILENYYEMLVG